jgi:DNA polymerase-3 subunit delta'
VSLESVLESARAGRLYPSVILHGGGEEARRAAALDLARVILCDGRSGAESCRRRVVWPGDPSGRFHPDFQVLERDLKTMTSVDAVKELLRGAQVSPFEAGAQVFVVASAETLSPEAANALLKSLEEPHLTAPRHFFLLTPSQFDLLPTLRSRSLAVFLGAPARTDPEALNEVVEGFAAALDAWREGRSAADLLVAAAALAEAGDFADARAARPWTLAAKAVLAASRRPGVAPSLRRDLLALADALLAAPPWRLRGVQPQRILEGLVSGHLAGGR